MLYKTFLVTTTFISILGFVRMIYYNDFTYWPLALSLLVLSLYVPFREKYEEHMRRNGWCDDGVTYGYYGDIDQYERYKPKQRYNAQYPTYNRGYNSRSCLSNFSKEYKDIAKRIKQNKKGTIKTA